MMHAPDKPVILITYNKAKYSQFDLLPQKQNGVEVWDLCSISVKMAHLFATWYWSEVSKQSQGIGVVTQHMT